MQRLSPALRLCCPTHSPAGPLALRSSEHDMMRLIKRYRRRSRSRSRVRKLLRGSEPIRLEIGSGPVAGKGGWTTLDLSSRSDLHWDLSDGLPFPSNSIQQIYSSHVLEHFSYRELLALLHACADALEPGGSFSACVPDAGRFIAAYVHGKALDTRGFWQPALQTGSALDLVNYVAYMDGQHKQMFDAENLPAILEAAGFTAARVREFDPEVDAEARREESLYAVAHKPAAVT